MDMFRSLGYATNEDASSTGQNELGFCFDDLASKATIRALALQIAPIVHKSEQGVHFGELFSAHCNSSPADSARYRLAIEQLIEHKELIVLGEKGQQKRRATTINDRDLLKVANQRVFWPMA